MNGQQLPLEDIILPSAVGFWPLAPGWWLLALLFIIGSVAAIFFYFRWQQQRKVMRAALKLLSEARSNYANSGNISNYCRDINQLLKRFWRHSSHDTDVLSTTGDEWVRQLNSCCKSDVFTDSTAQALAEGTYRPLDNVNPDLIESATQKWLRQARIPKAQSSYNGGSHA